MLKRKVKKGRLIRLVYTARDPLLKTTVVVKRNANVVEASREAQVMQAYGDSPSLVSFHRYFELHGRGFIVMERAVGVTLRALIQRGRVHASKVVHIARGILSGLRALHDAGYVHGDLQSRNVIVSPGSAPTTTVIDFQFAVPKDHTGEARAIRALARPPKYAPESRARIIGDSYDIYSVGYMCACMLMGRELRWVPCRVNVTRDTAGLWRIIRKALRRDPKQRYQSAQAMLDALEELDIPR